MANATQKFIVREEDSNETVTLYNFHRHCQGTILSVYGHQLDGTTQDVFEQANFSYLPQDWRTYFNRPENKTITHDLLSILDVVDQTAYQLIERIPTSLGGQQQQNVPFTIAFKDTFGNVLAQNVINPSGADMEPGQELPAYEFQLGRVVELEVNGATLKFNTVRQHEDDITSITLPEKTLTFKMNGQTIDQLSVPMQTDKTVELDLGLQTQIDDNLKMVGTATTNRVRVISSNHAYFIDASNDFSPTIDLSNYQELDGNIVSFELHVHNVSGNALCVNTPSVIGVQGFDIPWQQIVVQPTYVAVIEFKADFQNKLLAMHLLWEHRTLDSDLPFLNYNADKVVTGVNNSVCVVGDLLDRFQIGIGDSVFTGSAELRSLEAPNNVSIGKDAFKNCTSLEKVVVSPGISFIGSSAFQGCSNLIGVLDSNGNAIVGAASRSWTERDGEGEGDGEHLVSLAIGSSAFQNCTTLPQAILPARIASIGSNAFKGCTGLTDVVIAPTTPLTIGSSAFAECSSIGILVLGPNVNAVANNVF